MHIAGAHRTRCIRNPSLARYALAARSAALGPGRVASLVRYALAARSAAWIHATRVPWDRKLMSHSGGPAHTLLATAAQDNGQGNAPNLRMVCMQTHCLGPLLWHDSDSYMVCPSDDLASDTAPWWLSCRPAYGTCTAIPLRIHAVKRLAALQAPPQSVDS